MCRFLAWSPHASNGSKCVCQASRVARRTEGKHWVRDVTLSVENAVVDVVTDVAKEPPKFGNTRQELVSARVQKR